MKYPEILLIYGIPPLRPSNIEIRGVPFSPSLKTVLRNNVPIHLSYPALGVAVLATFLKKLGFHVQTKDWYLESVDPTQFQIIGISTTYLYFENLQEIAKSVKASNPKCKLVIGGPMSWTHSFDYILKTIPEIDFIVLREGEKTFLDLIISIVKNTDSTKVKGIALRVGKKMVATPQREPLDPKEILAPDWFLINLRGRTPMLPIETSRGCIYNCAFCSEVHFWGKPVRFRSIKSVIAELNDDVFTHGISTFRISDSCFSAPEKRCIDICEAMEKAFTGKGIPFQWSSFARVTNLNKRLLEKMKKAGCRALDIGMESGDEAILQTMNKLYSPQDIVNCITYAKELGIITHCNVVVGFPGETKDSIENTIDILNRAQPDSYHCMILDIAPNTDLANNKEKYGITGDRIHWKHSTMSSIKATASVADIIKKVSPSCLFVAGEMMAIMLIAAGYTPDDVRSFFRNIAFQRGGKREAQMIDKVTKISLLKKLK
jgi:anaerobic magnesium-protoporphyrin IX monomethyl ester cyclase